MSYHIYTTEAIILKRSPVGEGNILLSILTHDFGLIVASVQSARLEKSKLRPSVQEYSLVNISCVKAKGGWRVVDSSVIKSFFSTVDISSQDILVKVCNLLLKMMPEEGKHSEIFDTVESGFETLNYNQNKNIIECLLVLRILYYLGYVSPDGISEFLISSSLWDLKTLSLVGDKKPSIIKLINNGLSASHL